MVERGVGGEVVVGFGKPQEVTEEEEKEEGRECRGACIASWDEHLVLFAVLIHVYYLDKKICERKAESLR